MKRWASVARGWGIHDKSTVLQLRFHKTPNLVATHTTVPKRANEIPAQALRRRYPRGACDSLRAAGAEFGNKGAHAVAEIQKALLLELPVNPRHGVRIYNELLGERPDCGKAIPRMKCAGFHRVPNLLLELEVDRHTGGRVGLEEECQCNSV